MTAPVQRTTVEGVLGNHEKRVGILEATVAGKGDYVFLSEATVVNDGDIIEFTAITQIYRHLVIEWAGCTAGTYADSPGDVHLGWGTPSYAANYYNDDYMWGQGWEWDPVNLWNAENDTFEDAFIPVYNVVPTPDMNGAGGGAQVMGTGWFKFPYYSRTDFMKTVTWMAQGQVQDYAPGNATSVINALSVGGGSQAFDNKAIDRIRLDVFRGLSSVGWAASPVAAVASLYGIR